MEVDFEPLDASVRRVNGGLSHPEQVKRWIVRARPLSLAAKELTPNLKLRRTNVARTRSAAIDVRYQAGDDFPLVVSCDDVLHGGKA